LFSLGFRAAYLLPRNHQVDGIVEIPGQCRSISTPNGSGYLFLDVCCRRVVSESSKRKGKQCDKKHSENETGIHVLDIFDKSANFNPKPDFSNKKQR
jgi:hypothetical protein